MKRLIKESAVGVQDGGGFLLSVKRLVIIIFFPVILFVIIIFLVPVMFNITREQLVSILDEKLAPFKQTIDDLRSSLEANNFMKFASKQYDEMSKKVDAFEAENELIRSENKVLKKSLETMDRVLQSVKKAYNDLEQYGRRECVEIRGVPMPSHPSEESTNEIAKNLGKLMGVKISDNDISVSHRVPLSSKNKKSVPAPIIVKFTRREKKDEFYSARMKLKKVTARDLGYRFNTNNYIFINESLTSENRNLFNEALRVKKQSGYKFFWTLNGQIYLRKSADTSSINIRCSDDLARL